MNLGLEYIKYRWNAKGRRSIHSPFVSDLIENCLTIKLKQEDSIKLETIVNELKVSTETIEIEDFGAGSKRLGNIRPISLILKNSSSKGKYGDFLYQVSKHHRFNQVLEFGTSLGIGTTYMYLGNPSAEITTVEACKNTREVALNNFKTLEFSKIKSIHSTFLNYLDGLKEEKFDLIYVDGHHEGKALLDYMTKLKRHSHNKTMFILDDIRWSDSMFNAWNQIIQSDNYNLSIDLFRFGVVFPLPNEEKQHYSIKL